MKSIALLLITLSIVSDAEAGGSKFARGLFQKLPGVRKAIDVQNIDRSFLNAVGSTRKELQEAAIQSAQRGKGILGNGVRSRDILEESLFDGSEIRLKIVSFMGLNGKPETHLRLAIDSENPNIFKNAGRAFGKTEEDFVDVGSQKELVIEIDDYNRFELAPQTTKLASDIVSGTLLNAEVMPFEAKRRILR